MAKVYTFYFVVRPVAIIKEMDAGTERRLSQSKASLPRRPPQPSNRTNSDAATVKEKISNKDSPLNIKKKPPIPTRPSLGNGKNVHAVSNANCETQGETCLETDDRENTNQLIKGDYVELSFGMSHSSTRQLNVKTNTEQSTIDTESSASDQSPLLKPKPKPRPKPTPRPRPRPDLKTTSPKPQPLKAKPQPLEAKPQPL